MNNFYYWYKNIILTDLLYKLNLNNSFSVARLNNVCLTACFQSIIEKPKTVLYSLLAFKILTFQAPTICKAKHSLAAFNLRKGMLVGVKISLRKKLMYNFLCLFTAFVLPSLEKISFLNISGCFSIGIPNIFFFPHVSCFRNSFLKDFSFIININILNGDSLVSKLLLTGLQFPL